MCTVHVGAEMVTCVHVHVRGEMVTCVHVHVGAEMVTCVHVHVRAEMVTCMKQQRKFDYCISDILGIVTCGLCSSVLYHLKSTQHSRLEEICAHY